MKQLWLILTVTLTSVLSSNGQPKPAILATPADWRFEHFQLPPAFAPGVTYHGLEELRFSPGWGKRDAQDYFTVILGMRLDDIKAISEAEIKDYLLTYFKGLNSATARDRKLAGVDTTAITLLIKKKPATNKSPIYTIELHMFGVFTDGAPLTLHMEVKVLEDISHHSVYLHIIASPLPTTDPLWQQLYKEQQQFEVPV